MVGHLQAEAQHVDAFPFRVEQRDGVAVVVQREAGVQPGRLRGVIQPHHEIAVGRDHGAGREIEFPGLGRVVAQAPVLQVHAGSGDVFQLHVVGEGGAVLHRGDILGEHLVEDDQRLRAAWAWPAGGAALGQAGTPVGRRVGVALRLAKHERVAVAIGLAWPSAAVIVVHRQHRLAVAIDQGQSLTLVGESALVQAANPHAGIARAERLHIGVVDQQQVSTGGQRGAVLGKPEGDAFKGEAGQILLGVADVLQFDVLKCVAALRVVHDLGDPHRHVAAPDHERGLRQCAPLAGGHCARLDVRAVVKDDSFR